MALGVERRLARLPAADRLPMTLPGRSSATEPGRVPGKPPAAGADAMDPGRLSATLRMPPPGSAITDPGHEPANEPVKTDPARELANDACDGSGPKPPGGDGGRGSGVNSSTLLTVRFSTLRRDPVR